MKAGRVGKHPSLHGLAWIKCHLRLKDASTSAMPSARYANGVLPRLQAKLSCFSSGKFSSQFSIDVELVIASPSKKT